MKITLKKSAYKELLKIPLSQREIIEKKTELLTDNPFPTQVKKL